MNGNYRSLGRKVKMVRPDFMASPYSEQDLGHSLQGDARRMGVAPWYTSGSTYGVAEETVSAVASGISALVGAFAPAIGAKKRAATAAEEYQRQVELAQMQASSAATTQRTLMFVGGGLVLAGLAFAAYKVI